MSPLRLLVTGSRSWNHPLSVDAILKHYTNEAFSLGHTLLVVHGKAVRGADALAASWVHKRRLNGWPVAQEAHPAHWSAPCVPSCQEGHRQPRDDGSDYCPQAGHRRNQEMVDATALVCVGFNRNGSSGTRDCMRRAKLADIPLCRVNWSEREQIDARWLALHAPPLAVVL